MNNSRLGIYKSAVLRYGRNHNITDITQVKRHHCKNTASYDEYVRLQQEADKARMTADIAKQAEKDAASVSAAEESKELETQFNKLEVRVKDDTSINASMLMQTGDNPNVLQSASMLPSVESPAQSATLSDDQLIQLIQSKPELVKKLFDACKKSPGSDDVMSSLSGN